VTSQARYVYAVCRADADVPTRDLATVGPARSRLHKVVHRHIAAIVSPYDGDWVPASRANLRAHTAVVDEAAARGAAVPVRFGVVMPDEGAVREDLLRPNAASLSRLLHRFEHVKEFRLQASYHDDVVIREAASADRTVRRMLHPAGAASRSGYHDQIALGEAVAAAVEDIQRRDEVELLRHLAAVTEDNRVLPVDPAVDAFGAAFLVADRERAAFERTVDEIATANAKRMQFHLVGPLPAWDFVELPFASEPDDPRALRTG